MKPRHWVALVFIGLILETYACSSKSTYKPTSSTSSYSTASYSSYDDCDCNCYEDNYYQEDYDERPTADDMGYDPGQDARRWY